MWSHWQSCMKLNTVAPQYVRALSLHCYWVRQSGPRYVHKLQATFQSERSECCCCSVVTHDISKHRRSGGYKCNVCACSPSAFGLCSITTSTICNSHHFGPCILTPVCSAKETEITSTEGQYKGPILVANVQSKCDHSFKSWSQYVGCDHQIGICG